MYSKRGLDILRASVNKDRVIFKKVKLENCKSTLCKTVIFNCRNQHPCSYVYPSTVVGSRLISQFVQNRSVHIIRSEVPIRKSVDAATEEKKNEDIFICEPPVDFDLISSSLQVCSSIEEQLEKLCMILRLTPEDIESRRAVCKSVEDMLSPFFENCNVQMYGSSVNSLGFKGCDIDMSFCIPGSMKKAVSSVFFNDIDIPSIEDVTSGKVSAKELTELPLKEQLLFVYSVFVKNYKDTSEHLTFINAFVPIIRFHNATHKLQCDLTYGNRVAYGNTKLLNFFGKLDRRYTLLMVAIRYWAKHVGLIGKGLMFNSYTISLLVVYFLQTRNPPVLPTVEFLLSISDAFKNEDMQDCSYLDDISKIPPSENKQTTEELLKEFFVYFTYFDYNQVICPLTGTSVPRKDFILLNPKFRMNTISIQDPLKLVHNVANFVEYKMCRLLLKELLIAVKISHDNTLWHPNSSKWGFLSILDKPACYSTSLIADVSQLSFEISKSSDALEDLDKSNKIDLISQSNKHQVWLHRTTQAILDVLEYALLFKCTIVSNPNSWTYNRFQNETEEKITASNLNQILTLEKYNYHNLKKSKMPFVQTSQLKDSSSSVQNVLLTADCCAFEKTWLGREGVKMDNISVDPLEMEHAISSKLYTQETDETNEEKKILARFICECSASETENKKSVIVKFKPSQRFDFNPILGLFLSNYVPKVVNQVLQMPNTELPERQNVSNSC